MVVFGVALGVLDVQQARAALDRAMQERSARAIGERLFIRDPWFVVTAWRERLSACSRSAWCAPAPVVAYVPPAASTARDPAVHACLDSLRALPGSADGGTPALGSTSNSYLDCALRGSGGAGSLRGLSFSPPTPLGAASSGPAPEATTTPTGSSSGSSSDAWWRRLWPVAIVRMTILPIVQTGWALFALGWTARIVFALSFVVAFLLSKRSAEKSESLQAALVIAVLSFLATSVVLSFGFNLLLRVGNAVAGYWGVLVALASGIYVMVELATKLRDLAQMSGAGRA